MAETSYSNIKQRETEVQACWASLPIDLFTTILLRVLAAWHFTPPPQRPTALEGLLQLKTVSSRWSQIIDATPVLWTFLSYEDFSYHTDLALKRSANALLSIICRGQPWNSALATSFIAKVAPHVERWKNVGVDDFTWTLIHPATLPNLESLEIEGNYRDTPLPAALLGEECTSLQHLTLTNVALAVNQPLSIGQSLRSLSLQRLGSSLTYRQIYNILLQNPDLIDVTFEIYISSSTNIVVEPLSDINLPRLRILHIVARGNRAEHISFLRALKAPNCMSFSFHISNLLIEIPNALAATAPYFTQVIPKTGSKRKLEGTFGPGFFRIGLNKVESRGQEPRDFILCLAESHQKIAIQWLSNLLVESQPHIACLTIRGTWCSEDMEEELVRVLVAMKGVNELHLKDTSLGMWKLLGRPASRKVGLASESWLLPDLERLVVDEFRPTREYSDTFVATVHARESAGIEMRRSGSELQDYPVPLRSLLYRTTHGEKSGLLAELLGDRYSEYVR